jgi:uncharacterized protein YigA (DUF484 family)
MDHLELQRINEEIARRFQAVEKSISSAGDEKVLFETLLERIREEFEIPFVWLSIVDKPELKGLIGTLQSSDILKDRLNVIDELSYLELTAGSLEPLLANGDMKPFFRLLPKNHKYLLRSVAIAPVTLHTFPIGSLNHGDSSPLRYQPGMDTSLLAHLAAEVSELLSGILSRPQS